MTNLRPYIEKYEKEENTPKNEKHDACNPHGCRCKNVMKSKFHTDIDELHSKCANQYIDEFSSYDTKIIDGIKYAFDFLKRKKEDNT